MKIISVTELSGWAYFGIFSLFHDINSRGFDLANHFAEWTMDYTHPEPPYFTFKPQNFPSREQQLHFIRNYLDAFPTKNESCRLEEEENILKEVVR